MIDSNLKPWLIEINGPPALSVDSDIDIKVKYPLVRDMINALYQTEQSDIIQYCNSAQQSSSGLFQKVFGSLASEKLHANENTTFTHGFNLPNINAASST
jgi:hypothetical protein